MFPDASLGGKAHQQWLRKAATLTSQGFRVEVSDMLERHAGEEQRAAGYDLADLLLGS
jgi:hypothetical protein